MSHNVLARFYGGSWDGEVKSGNYTGATRVYVAILDKNARELYERERSLYKRNNKGEIIELAYRFQREEPY